MLAALLVAAALALSLTLGFRGFAGGASPLREQLEEVLTRSAGPAVVYSEFNESSDTLWAANPNDPKDRVEIASAEHALGYGVAPVLSPDGSQIAYAALPAGIDGLGLETIAELWLLDVSSGKARRLATNVDLLFPPIWSPAGDAVVVRSGAWVEGGGANFRLLRIGTDGAEATLVDAPAELFPIDFAPDGAWFYYAALTADGTTLHRAPSAGGESEALYRLSEGFARDWRLSPDGAQLAYLAQAPAGAADPFDVRVLDLETGETQAPVDDATPALNPLWDGNGALTVGRVDQGSAPARYHLDGERVALDAQPLPAPVDGRGFDVPLSWSPDRGRLAVRAFEGASLADPGPSRVVVMGTDGSRRELSPRTDIEIAGWLEALP